MGSFIKLNGMLKLKEENGFPTFLQKNKIYEFNLPDMRLFMPSPSPVYLIHEIEKKWKFVGTVNILEQTINSVKNYTTGKFILKKLFDEEYSKLITQNEAPEGKSFY